LVSVPFSSLHAIRTLAARGIATRSSSVGRLFDCASALLGVRLRSSYEGEAAIALEQAADGFPVADPYPWTLSDEDGLDEIDSRPLIAALAADVAAGALPAGLLAARFHATLIEALLESVRRAARRTGLRTVALSGGALQNRILATHLETRLAAEGFEVLSQTAVPANDGGIALGQALAALAG
jgi:hydrogenase maturation protein HypF